MYKVYCWSDRFKKMWAYSRTFYEFGNAMYFLSTVYKPTHYYLHENSFIYKIVDVHNNCSSYYLVMPFKKNFNIIYNIKPDNLNFFMEGLHD